jgi:tetratricopeptide (TPR) repeat protein
MSESSFEAGRVYRAFISYSHVDELWADWLHKELEAWRVPSRLIGTQAAHGVIPRTLRPVFRDTEELASATDLGGTVEEALRQSENLIVICSPAAAASRWVNQEVLAFKRMNRGERVFCLVVGGEPNGNGMPGREAEECFCPALRFKLDSQGQPTRTRTEPAAADVRPGKDSKETAKLKLIAGMLGIGFDTLRQREHHRRMRRMVAVTVLALAMMAVTSALAIYALNSRHDAVIAQQAAERRQKQAEDMVAFMLGDLNDKLNAVGRLDILQAVDDKAMAYFASLPAADATDDALAMRVTALQKIAGVRSEQGNTPAALESYQAASALAAELARRAPRDPKRRAAYADSLKWVGQTYWYQGDLKRAIKNFEAADTALRASLAAQPGDPTYIANLAYIQTNIGRVLEARGDLTGARGQYESVLKIFRGLQARQPAEENWQSEVGFAWNNLGKLALQQGRFVDAINAFRSDQQIKTTLADKTPDDRQRQEDLLVSNAMLGRTLALCGDVQGAMVYTRSAVESARKLVAADPTNASWQEYFALYSQQLGSMLRQSGRLNEAAAAYREAIRNLAALAAMDPTFSDYAQELAQSRMELAQLQLVRGNPQAARRSAEAALATLEKLGTTPPKGRNHSLPLAQAQILMGRIAARRGDTATARRYWTRARDALEPTATTDDDPRQLATYAEALLRLGDNQQARPVVSKLNAMGYRTPDFAALVIGAKLPYPANAVFLQGIASSKSDAKP